MELKEVECEGGIWMNQLGIISGDELVVLNRHALLPHCWLNNKTSLT
jgi:hypothetical protein